MNTVAEGNTVVEWKKRTVAEGGEHCCRRKGAMIQKEREYCCRWKGSTVTDGKGVVSEKEGNTVEEEREYCYRRREIKLHMGRQYCCKRKGILLKHKDSAKATQLPVYLADVQVW